MQYLGGLRGAGILTSGNETVARASYDFDGFLTDPGEVMCCGEIRLPPQALRKVFGRKDLQLLTEEGRLLSLRFPRGSCVQRRMPLTWMSPANCHPFPSGATNRISSASSDGASTGINLRLESSIQRHIAGPPSEQDPRPPQIGSVASASIAIRRWPKRRS